MPFARVAQHGFLQPNVSDGAQTHVMSLDTNYTVITPSQYVLSHRELARFTPTFFLQQKWWRPFLLVGYEYEGCFGHGIVGGETSLADAVTGRSACQY